jgi:ABC-type multidrug transport system ATPase subunit
MAREHLGVTVVVVTHDPSVADVADRTVAIRDGRTSAERIRVDRTRVEAGTGTVTHLDYVVVDRAGRLQIPKEFLLTLGIEDRAVIGIEEGRIFIGPVTNRPVQ